MIFNIQKPIKLRHKLIASAAVLAILIWAILPLKVNGTELYDFGHLDMPQPAGDTMDLIVEGGAGFICLDTTGFNGLITSINNTCALSSGDAVIFTIDFNDYCVGYVGVGLGIDTACINICDAFGDCEETIVIIEVIDANPVANDDIVTIPLGQTSNIDVLANDTVPIVLDSLTLVFVQDGFTAAVNADNEIEITPDDGFCGSGIVQYEICNSFGCDRAFVEAEVPCPQEPIFYNGFSPNGDGVNDVFTIEGIEGYPNSVLRIFNRWGNQVHVAEAYLNDWDGTWDGKNLPDGTYFYVLELNDASDRSFTGYVQLHR